MKGIRRPPPEVETDYDDDFYNRPGNYQPSYKPEQYKPSYEDYQPGYYRPKYPEIGQEPNKYKPAYEDDRPYYEEEHYRPDYKPFKEELNTYKKPYGEDRYRQPGQVYRTQPRPVYPKEVVLLSPGPAVSTNIGAYKSIPDGYSASSVPGTAGKDYPNYSEVPHTSFDCQHLKKTEVKHADPETGCQVNNWSTNTRRRFRLG